MAFSGIGRTLWTPTLRQQEAAAAPSPFGSLPKTQQPEAHPAEKLPAEAVSPAGPEEYDRGRAAASRIAAGPIAAAALGPIAAAAAVASSGAEPSDPMQSLLREVTAHDEDTAAAIEAFQDDSALLGQRTEQPRSAEALRPGDLQPEPQLYGTGDAFRGYKTVGVVDTGNDRGAAAAARTPEPLAPAEFPAAALSEAVGAGGARVYGIPREMPPDDTQGGGYCWRGPLEEPLLQPTPGQAGVALSYSTSSRQVTFADRYGAVSTAAARPAYGDGRSGGRLGPPAAARLAVLLFTAAAISGWWTFACVQRRECAAWSVLWGVFTAVAASTGTYLGVTAAMAGGSGLTGHQPPGSHLANVAATTMAGTGAGAATADRAGGGDSGFTTHGSHDGNGSRGHAPVC